MRRREFLKSVPVGGSLLAQAARAAAPGPARVEPFNYQGVRLRESRWRQQVETAREYYLSLSDDDILLGFRQAAGLPARGKTLGGWCRENSSTVFGQWLSGMARLQCATGDSAVRAKATSAS